MALISGGVPNLHQGVSQQPDPLRDPTQGDLQVNGVSSPIGGLRKREGSEALAFISGQTSSFERVAFHHIRWDDNSQYLAVLSRTTVRVFRLDGTEIPVTMGPGAAGYLSQASDPSLDLRCSTVGDYTFVTNTRVRPAMNTALTPVMPRPAPHEALVWVKAANYGQVYSLSVNGVAVKVETAVAPTTVNAEGTVVANRISPADIAERLRAGLIGGIVRRGDGLYLGGGAIQDLKKFAGYLPTINTAANTTVLNAFSDGEGIGLTCVVKGNGFSVTDIQWDFSNTFNYVIGENIFLTEGQLDGTDSIAPVYVGTVTTVLGCQSGRTGTSQNVPTVTDRGGEGLTLNITFGNGRVTGIAVGNSQGRGYVAGDKIYVLKSALYVNGESTLALIGTIRSASAGRLSGVQIDISNSTLYLKSSRQLSIIVSGGNGNSDITAISDKVQHIADLPAIAPDRYVVEIEGDKANRLDSYYVNFQAAFIGFGSGVWEETAAPGVEYKIRTETMPHLLVKSGVGEDFWFGYALPPGTAQPNPAFKLPSWGQRVSGDYVSNPNPSFIGTPINDVFVYQNRLCFLSGESCVCSRAQKYFDFFRETVATPLDSDPVDVTASQDNISVLSYAVPYQDEVILFSQQNQFRLTSDGEVFSAASARIAVLTNYQCDLGARPIPMAGGLVFSQRNGDWTQIKEFRTYGSGSSVNAEATDITAQVNTYIPASVKRLVNNDAANILIVLSDKKCYTNRLYIYKYLNESEGGSTKRTQSSWSYWEFCTDEIKAILLVDQSLYMVCKYGDQIWIDKLSTADRPPPIPLGAAQSDEPLLTPHEMYLDRKFTNTQRSAAGARVPQGVYDPITDTTTWTLPFYPRCRVQAWTSYLGKDVCAPCVSVMKVGDAAVTPIPATCVTVLAIKDATTPPPERPPMPPPVCVTVMSVKDATTTPPAPP